MHLAPLAIEYDRDDQGTTRVSQGLRRITFVKKNTSAASPSGKHQNTSQEMLRSVVTRLQANAPSARKTAPQTQEPDVDLNELRAAIDELPEMNATKVVALHRRIVNGDYQIDSERLAGKLIELESSLDSE